MFQALIGKCIALMYILIVLATAGSLAAKRRRRPGRVPCPPTALVRRPTARHRAGDRCPDLVPAVALERTAEELQMRAQQRSIVTLIGQQAIPTPTR